MKQIKVSVAVITYNHERFLGQALESILSQKTNFTYEIVVGEDCSPDGTKKILEHYVKAYPDKLVPLYHKKNLGMNGNILEVLKHCGGEYIALLEGDDFWIDENKLQKQVDFLNSHPAYIAVAHECNLVDVEGNVVEPLFAQHHLEKGEYTIENLERFEMPAQTACFMFRNISDEIQKYAGKLQHQRIPLDRIFPFVLLKKGRMHILADVMASYRYYIEVDGTNWSSTHDISVMHNYLTYYFYIRQMEQIGRQFGFQLNMMAAKGKMFYDAYQYAKRNKSFNGYMQAALMYLAEPRKVQYFKLILSYKKRG